MPVVTGNKQTS